MDFSIGTYLYPLAVSILGSLHCMGMCSGFVLLMSKNSPSEASYGLYQLGKTTGYLLLATGVFLISGLLTRYDSLEVARYGLTFIAGVTMAWLAITGLLKFRYPLLGFTGITKWLGGSASNPLFFGFLNGLMPCGLVYMLLVAIPLTDSWLQVLVLVGLFGLGTVPSLWIIRRGWTLLSQKNKDWMERVLYGYLFIFGMVTIFRGIPVTEAFVHGLFPHSIQSLFKF